ncbi:hypothetical protein GQ43DRAFT_311351 [Delitschia confertaspora ATCC 74209]|uniref:Uncharacterized protein n=1 Tax=Delitschia confertaspora ATCC 74209 TaxID=1513339 RepID=A0A9P4JNC5_9PLEO|nr:hypothetical protein GQ43DRAFT_311351 [Delitschia confertaspora ATCC 74209]
MVVRVVVVVNVEVRMRKLGGIARRWKLRPGAVAQQHYARYEQIFCARSVLWPSMLCHGGLWSPRLAVSQTGIRLLMQFTIPPSFEKCKITSWNLTNYVVVIFVFLSLFLPNQRQIKSEYLFLGSPLSSPCCDIEESS